jgi:hypothetical protein
MSELCTDTVFAVETVIFDQQERDQQPCYIESTFRELQDRAKLSNCNRDWTWASVRQELLEGECRCWSTRL